MMEEREARALKLFDKVDTNEQQKLFAKVNTNEQQKLFDKVNADEIPKKYLFGHISEIKKEEQKTEELKFTEQRGVERQEKNLERKEKLFGIVENRQQDSFNNVVTMLKEPKFRMENFWYEGGELKYQSREMPSAVVIGNFWIEINEEITRISEVCNEQNLIIGYHEDTSWKIKIFCMGQSFETEKKVKGLLSDTELLKITKDRGYIESGKECRQLFRKYINILISKGNYAKTYLYDTAGWIKLKGRGYVYLIGEGIIGEKAGNIKADVPYHFLYLPEQVGTKQIFEEFLGTRELCNCNGKKENSVFLMHYSNVAVMTTLFQDAGKGVNFIVALIGSTNSQKTAVGLLFSRLFDRTPSYSPDIRFNSTEVAIMEKMSQYGDAILMVDDFVPYSAKGLAADQRKKSETIIRSYGDREPRKRSKTYAKINDVPEYSPVKGCCLITGEIFQTESESSDTRVVKLQFERGDVDLEMLTHYQETLLNFSTFFYDFIYFVQCNVERVQNIMREELREIRKQKICGISTPRFIDTLAIMSAGVKIFYSYAYAKGFLNAEEVQKYMAEDMEKITKVIVKNDRESKTKSPAVNICLALKKGIQQRKISLCSLEDLANYEDFSQIAAEDEQYIYILPETLCQLYREYCKNIGEEVIYRTGRDLNGPMRKENLLLIKTEGKNQQQRSTHKIGNFTSKRFFHIKKSEMEKIMDIFEKF